MQLKHLGNEAFKQQNYHDAIQRYDDALRILQVCQPAGRELAVLFCNRSNAFYNLEMWDDAFLSAHYATAMDSTYIKGYYWAGSASLKRHDNMLASQFFYEGLNILDGDREKSHYQIADFIVGILTANGADANSDAIFKWKKYNLLIWQTVIDKAAKKILVGVSIFFTLRISVYPWKLLCLWNPT